MNLHETVMLDIVEQGTDNAKDLAKGAIWQRRDAVSEDLVLEYFSGKNDHINETFLSFDLKTQQRLLGGSQNLYPFFLAKNDLFAPHDMTDIIPKSTRDKLKQQRPEWCAWAQHGLSLAVTSKSYVALSKSAQNGQPQQTLAQQSADLIIQSLRAFPVMMLRKQTWPWFIHPQTHLLWETGVSRVSDSLSTCMAIAQMYVLGSVDTRIFVWQAVRAECNCYNDKMLQMSRFDVLTALQACMIYLVMYIIEDIPTDQRLGSVLLQVLYDFYFHAKTIDDGCTAESEITEPRSNWADWIFAESRRRLASLWLLVGSVIRVRTNGVKDQSESHRALPLPCGKSLWEAYTESTWRAEYDANQILDASGLVNLGDLIDAQKTKEMPLSVRKLDIWSANADQLGFLLTLVSTMV